MSIKDRQVPDFIVVGAAKSGTTSLHKYLSQHPNLYLPELKESWFFCLHNNPNQSIRKLFPQFNFPSSWSEYQHLFSEADNDQITGEITPAYLHYHKLTIENIQKYCRNWKDIRIIIILREPIDKIISHFKYTCRSGLEKKAISLSEALEKREERIGKGDIIYDLLYIENTLYYHQVKAYKQAFPKCDIYLYDEFKKDPTSVLNKIVNSLNLSNIKWNTNLSFNKGTDSIPKNRIAKLILNNKNQYRRFAPKSFRKFMKRSLKQEIEIDNQALSKLRVIFKPEIEKLQKILDHDLSAWLDKY
ncbi:MAG: sulfotransferase [Bacteroidota bacterium]